MRTATGIAAALVLAACGKSDDARTRRCEKVWTEMASKVEGLGQAFGEDLSAELGGEAKRAFLKTCREVPDELLPCLADPASAPDCDEQLRAHKRTSMGPGPKLAWKTIELGPISARVPEGWEHEELMGDTYTPPKSAKLGFFSELRIDSSCGGACGPMAAAEWAKRVDAEVLARVRASFGVDKDEPLGDTGRLLVYHNTADSAAPVDLHVLAVWWADGGAHYVTCQAELDDELAGNLAEFEAACRDVKVKSFTE